MSLIIKVLGAVLIILTGAGFGFLASVKLTLREKQLAEYEGGISELKTRLYYEGNEKERLIKGVFTKKEIEYLNDGKIKIAADALTNEDKKILEDFFRRLGSTERDGEVRRADMCLELLKVQREKAQAASREKKDLYKSLGLCCGIFGSILMI